MISIKEGNMQKIRPGIQLWWNKQFAIVDYFKKRYGEPVKCLEIGKDHEGGSLFPDRLVTIRTSSGQVKKRFSESYFKTSPTQ